MNQEYQPTVLDVGQCDVDHSGIAQMLMAHFHAHVDRAHNADGAWEKIRDGNYALVLVNRILDRNGTEGLALIRRLQADPVTQDTPIMLVSNYADAQDAAVALGAQRGFGKNDIYAAQPVELLSALLT